MMGSFPTVYLQNNSSPGKETPKPCLPTFPSLQPRKHPSTLCTLPARRRPAPGAPPPGPHPHPAPSLAPMACEPHLEGGVPLGLVGGGGEGAYRISKSGRGAPQRNLPEDTALPVQAAPPRPLGPRCPPLRGRKMSAPKDS